jgi:hypothetical protein
MMTQQSYCQVSSDTNINMKQLKNEAKIALNDYTFESMAYKSYDSFENKKSVKAEFSVFSGEKYKISDISQGFKKPIILNLYDSKDKIVASNVYYPTCDTFEFVAQYSGEYVIEFVFNKEDYEKFKGKFVAFVLGYK